MSSKQTLAFQKLVALTKKISKGRSDIKYIEKTFEEPRYPGIKKMVYRLKGQRFESSLTGKENLPELWATAQGLFIEAHGKGPHYFQYNFHIKNKTLEITRYD